MSLATRCSACGTVFRVVQDQLRVSGGWVRCGRCGEVFNAVDSLVDLETDAVAGQVPSADQVPLELPTPDPAAAPSLPAEPPALTSDAAADDAGLGEAAAQADPDTVAAPAAAPDEPAAPSPAPASQAMSEAAPDPATEYEAEPDARAEAGDESGAEADAESERHGESVSGSETAPAPTPGFVRNADRAARWRRPQVRALLWLALLLALGGLAAQVMLTQHDWLAARWPALTPTLQRICEQAGCTVRPPMRIDALSVESSGLHRAGPPGAYRLQVLLRNHAQMPVRWPHLDLSLTDAQGKTLARRVLTPAQLGAAQDRIGARAEATLATTLRMRDARVVGYTIEIFYP